MATVPYLILERKPLGPYNLLDVGMAENMAEDSRVENLLDHAVARISTTLDASQQVAKVPVPLAFMLLNPISTFVNRSIETIAQELGVVDEAFLRRSAAEWLPGTPLSQTAIKTEENVAQLLVILTLIHPRSLASNREDELQYVPFSREEILDAACKRNSPSAGAHNSTLLTTQKENKPDAMYNGRPLALTAPPIEIYHPIFAAFRRKMSQPTKDFKFSAAELEQSYTFITKSLAFYENKDARRDQLDVLRELVHENFLDSRWIPSGSGTKFNPDGVGIIPCQNFLRKPRAAIFFTEVKNGVGEDGSDPISQLQCDYTAFYSADLRKPLRDVCCCPAFLIGIVGPYLMIAGAVFADRFISQNLTDYLYIGGSPFVGPRVNEIGKVFRILKECLADLERYYSELTPPIPPASRNPLHHQPLGTSKTSPLALFPHFKKFTHATTGCAVELEYTQRLLPQYPDKAVFKAFARSSDGHAASTVVVKFTPTYCQQAHALLQKNALAPRLWLCENEETVGMYVVVMDFIAGRRIGGTRLSGEDVDALREGLRILHDDDLVFGDLRSPNIILPPEGKPVFVDFDWAGRAGEVTYPPDINMDLAIGWHPDVCRGGLIHREHDVFMLDRLERGN